MSLSPDNRRIAVERQETGRRQFRLWLFDAERGLPTRFTANESVNQIEPTWTSDNSGLIFGSGVDYSTEIRPSGQP